MASIPYWSEVLADTPSFLLECDEASGNLTDAVASLTATPSGSALTYRQAGPDAIGIPYSILMPLTAVLTINDNTAIRVSGSANFSLEAWLRMVTMPVTSKTFIKKNADDVGHDGYTLYNGSTHDWRLCDGDGDTAANCTADSTTTAFHHWVWVSAGTSGKIYRDGVDVTTSAVAITGGDSSDPLKIGSSQFNAYVAGIAIYKTALSGARVSAHYAARSNPPVSMTDVLPDADTTTTGWSATPLWSKIEETSADGTVITATSA